MFTIPKGFLCFIEGDGQPTDNGGGNSETEFNLGVPDNYGQDNNQEPDSGSEPEVKDNPAWQEVYDLLPAEFHPLIQPKLKSWDDNFAKVQSQYAPYKSLIERGVPIEAIQTSMDFANLLNSNPRAIYDELGQRFGFSGQGQQQVEEQDEEDDDTGDGVFEPQDLTQNPQFAQLQQAYQQLEQRLQQEDNAKRQYAEEQQALQEINSEWAAIESKVGQLPPQVKTEIIRRAVFLADQQGPNAVPNLQAGYNDYAQFVSRVRNTRANATAPDVMPGNGGLPKAKKSYGEMDEGEFVDTIAAMAKALAEGNN